MTDPSVPDRPAPTIPPGRVTDEAVERFAQKILELRREYEFRVFWCGTQLAGPVDPEQADAIKREYNRRVALAVLKQAPELDTELERAEIRFLLHERDGSVTPIPKSLWIFGRYLKLSREIPQKRWPCKRCYGKGCRRCNMTGRVYERSVEEYIEPPLKAASGAPACRMHTTGREDVDARMLGTGRPFVMELLTPRRRTFDLAPVEEEVRRLHGDEAQVRDLCFGDARLSAIVSTSSPDKSYRARVRCLSAAPRDAVLKLADLRDMMIYQETPRRVLHRRSNLRRLRMLRECSVEIVEGAERVTEFDLHVCVQAGTYVKELISGDEGRTQPCISQLLAIPCDCVALDVMAIHFDPVGEWEKQKADNLT